MSDNFVMPDLDRTGHTMSEPLDLDSLERTCADCCETVGELVAECRALRAEIDRLTHQLQMAEAVNDD